MNQRPSTLAAFHLIGERPEGDTGTTESTSLQPALFGAYRDLSTVRYDYPLVLLTNTSDGGSDTENGADQDTGIIKSLSDISDEILQEIAPRGVAGEEIRRHLLGLEQDIRSLVANGRNGSLLQLWDSTQRNKTTGGEKDANLKKARSALRYDGEIIDCDIDLPVKLARHAWAASRQPKEHRLGAKIDELAQKLSDILRVDFMHSKDARGTRHLQGSIGSADQTVFDFKVMSDILRSAPVGGALPKSRQDRIGAAISTLKSQRFVATTNGNDSAHLDSSAFTFAFSKCGKALKAFQDRLPDMAELVKAISIAELEIENRYDEQRHDAFFDRFDAALLGPEDMAMFPSYLVCLAEGAKSAAEQAAILEILCSGLPIKIVAQSNDILDDLPIGSDQLSFGTRDQQIANMAIGLGNVFVLQSAASSLYRLRSQILSGMANDRPALFSIFSGQGQGQGVGKDATAVAPYIRAAAATEARVFPCLVYDPEAGEDRASRFNLDGNPQIDADWPLHQLQYEDSEHNRLGEEAAFTFVDFAASDARYAEHFACVPQSDWHDDMVPVSEFLTGDDTSGGNGTATKAPYIPVIDDNNNLHRAIVDEKLIEGARRCRDLWRDLQQLGGLNKARKDAEAAAVLAAAKETWEQERQSLLAKSDSAKAPSAPAPTDSEPAPDTEAAASESPAPSTGDPFIETGRCTTCNECTDINSQMFAYDEDMQAFIKDADAGTYRELVEAAETCQVCIIHPGQPRNQDEPGLDELIERAAPFNA